MKVTRGKGVRSLFNRRARRGVLLLVILALLAMFGLVAVAFVLATGHAMRSSRAIQRIGQYDTRPREDLHQAFLQAVRGTNNRVSVMGPHSLFEDLCGSTTDTGRITGAQPVCNGQLIEVTYQLVVPDPPNEPKSIPDPYPQRRIGCVLTMLSGPAAGESTRIVGVHPGPPAGEASRAGNPQVLAFGKGMPGVDEDANNNGVLDQDEDLNGNGVLDLARFVINGTPFSGTGYGFNPETGKLDAVSSSWALALLPNDPLNRNPPGGANEDYDAVDFQNMLLGAQIVDATTGRVATIPSLHRPALVNYWKTRETATWDSSDWSVSGLLQRTVILRPLPGDHPDFTGSNPNFNPAWDGVTPGGGAWDVDNDGDGVPDGIWVDLGLPVRSMPDGRRYKPLFSILCVDMDGRLNLNAHGCLAQADPAYYGPATLQEPLRFAGGSQTPQLPRGQGYGPAEINLAPLFEDPANPGSLHPQWATLYHQLLAGNAAAGIDGRYGEVNVPAPAPGDSDQQPPGQLPDDLLGQNTGFEFWDPSAYYPPAWSYWAFRNDPPNYRPNAYGTPPDFDGNGSVGLDVAGRPLYLGMAEANEQVNDPYEIDLSPASARGLLSPAPLDNPFSVSEWERFLRPFDRDAGLLPNRLALLTSPTGDPRDSVLLPFRHRATPESWDLPCSSAVFSREALLKGVPDTLEGGGDNPVYTRLVNLPPPRHLSDVLTALLIKKGVDPAAAPGLLSQLFPPEMLAGLKMDLNRPFGDGHDNNSNWVVDEPFEDTSGSPEQLTLYNRPGNAAPVDFSYGPDGTVANSLLARQLHARHLYVLMLLLMDEEYGIRKSPPATPAQVLEDKELRARAVAQWAINVVDFRDRDSIMTPFPYDPNPFDGWNESPQYVVWGCERPELLISETLAFHDRRTENLAADGGEYDQQHVGEDGYDDHDDYDQRIRPQGSLLIELFNPWTEMEPRPGELYSGANGGVDLARMAGNSPVWRLVIAVPDQAGKTDPDDPVETNHPEIERSIYFRNPGGVATLSGDGRRYYPDPTNLPPLAPILPGRYAVIGPGEGPGPKYSTHTGFKTAGDDEPSSRRIELTPNQNPNLQQVAVFSDGTSNDLALNNLPAPIQPAVAVVINPPGIPSADGPRPVRLSVSEPTNGYPVYVPGDDTAQEYNPIQPEPLDETDTEFAALWLDGTTSRFRIVYLQRLANPLAEYHPLTNPYRTIDWAQIDLTAFNGVTTSVPGDPKADPDVSAGQYDFFTRERGEKEEKATPPPDPTNNLWTVERPNPLNAPPKAANPRQGPAGDRFVEAFAHTLGYLNEGFQPLYTPAGPGDTYYAGSPQIPFPWLNWNNRPFVSQLELLLVPAARSIELLPLYGLSPASPEPYTPTAPQNVPFPHLLNFFYSGKSAAAAPEPPQFHRLLEYLHVPSPFVGTQLQGNPAGFAAGSHSFHPPFHRISRYREPGRVNLNTVFDQNVFQGLMNNFPGMNTPAYWAKFVQSRRGYDGADILALNTASPTRFARPFRSFAGGQMVPLDTLKPPREIDATLLRSDPDPANDNRPLFRRQSLQPYEDTNRNPYFRYQGLQRLGNLVTTRSNVYAIWITVGYFEVDAVPVDVVHPDGYALGPELGIETGEVERHRAFYLIDRSIPVGFRRGQDLNVEKAVLLSRFIE